MGTTPPLPCLFSHKCDEPSHRVARSLSPIFRSAGLDLLVDPFGPGVDIGARIQTVHFNALVFLASAESLSSRYCKAELEIAGERDVPIFVIRWNSKLPKQLLRRLIVDWPNPPERPSTAELHQLAHHVQVRAHLHYQIQGLRALDSASRIRDAAESLATEPDTTALAEFLEVVAKSYRPNLDPIARYWMAIAMGNTQSPSAKPALLSWRDGRDHPFPQEGIRQALAMLQTSSNSR